MDVLNIIIKLMPLIITVIIIVAILIAVLVIRHKIRRFSRRFFGTNSLIDGIKEVQNSSERMDETPRSLHSMTSIYVPQIHKDFPQFDYELYKNKAESLLRSYFTAVSNKKASALTEECSPNLKNYVQGIIEDLNRRNLTQVFSESVIYQTELARYIKDGATVTILFNMAVGLYSFVENSDGKIVFGDRKAKKQTVYEVGLVYIQDADKVSSAGGSAMGLSCPNCGAPIKNLGQKFCDYCGTGVVEVNTRTWKFDSVKEQTNRKKVY